MAEMRLSRRAARDIAEIARFTHRNFGTHQAASYREALQHCFDSLAQHPMLGRSAEELAPELRRFEFRAHVVYYRPETSGIFVVRILHASMDPSSRL